MKIKIQKGNLSSYKRGAFTYGAHLGLFSKFYDAAKLEKTEFPAGQFMEIIIAWMLGYFRTITGLYMFVKITEELDKHHKTDFDIKTNDVGEMWIDMKFDKDFDTSLSTKSWRLVVTYPSKKGHADSGRTMTGEEALKLILSEVFYQDTLDRVLSGREDFISLINDTWDRYSNGW